MKSGLWASKSNGGLCQDGDYCPFGNHRYYDRIGNLLSGYAYTGIPRDTGQYDLIPINLIRWE
jgi:hypothetical protein